ncbi:MAG: protein kinase, partial [Reyranellales bacterium]
DAQLNREVAIKEYLPSALAVRQDGVTVLPRSTKMANDFTWGRQRFVDEGRTLATLQRAPAIVRVFDFLEANGTAYIVMELAPGDTLENRLKQGKLSSAEVERILWPLLDGLEQVHATGFLHRDIKPANILLGPDGSPTLIDFGASRAAMAGRTSVMTAIFTPGYAAAEQMTSAKQGPWTDIYGISATLYHAITGAPPPSAFDRMLDDEYQPLATLMPAGFAPGLLIGIDAGLAVRAGDRPQSIAGWRPILGQAGALDAQATVALGQPAASAATVVVRPSAAAKAAATVVAETPPAKSRAGLWVAIAAAVLVALGGGYYFATKPPAVDPVAAAEAQKAHEQLAAAEAAAHNAEADAAKLRAEKEQRDKADQEAAQRKQIETETRQKIEAEQAAARQKAEAEAAAKRQAEEEARQKEEAAAAAKRKAEEEDSKAAEAAETALHLAPLERQHIQVALTALGFDTNGTDGVFGAHSRDMITAWQRSRKYAATGFLTGPESQALQKEAAPAVSKFDDEQKAKAEVAAKAATVAAAPNIGSAGLKSGADGVWRGTYRCSPNKNAGDFNMNIQLTVKGGTGTWTRPGSGPGTRGNQSVTITINGPSVAVSRNYASAKAEGAVNTAMMSARYDGANAISGAGPEHYSGGRTCEITLTRAP